jgi:hypothetical protein
LDSGQITEYFSQIKEATTTHYEKLYTQESEEEEKEGSQQALLENIPTCIT